MRIASKVGIGIRSLPVAEPPVAAERARASGETSVSPEAFDDGCYWPFTVKA